MIEKMLKKLIDNNELIFTTSSCLETKTCFTQIKFVQVPGKETSVHITFEDPANFYNITNDAELYLLANGQLLQKVNTYIENFANKLDNFEFNDGGLTKNQCIVNNETRFHLYLIAFFKKNNVTVRNSKDLFKYFNS
jgi:hypothetical protein